MPPPPATAATTVEAAAEAGVDDVETDVALPAADLGAAVGGEEAKGRAGPKLEVTVESGVAGGAVGEVASAEVGSLSGP